MPDRRTRLWIELLALWAGVPVVILAVQWWAQIYINPFFVLWPGAVICLVAMLGSRRFEKRQLWNAAALRKYLPGVLIRWAILAPPLVLMVGLLTPEWFLGFPRQRPGLWAIVMVAYPIFSVYPQGLVYRAFFLHRYKALTGSDWGGYLLSGLCFGWVHIIFFNPAAPILTALGGILFARTHLKSRSLLVSSVEHALYGCTIFTFGWGKYFYHGAVQFTP